MKDTEDYQNGFVPLEKVLLPHCAELLYIAN